MTDLELEQSYKTEIKIERVKRKITYIKDLLLEELLTLKKEIEGILNRVNLSEGRINIYLNRLPEDIIEILTNEHKDKIYEWALKYVNKRI